ncbi:MULTISPECIES: LytR/AlgR family response regulator transcription factor [Clostridia]|uniref:LytR/AlgR family response regulator transcription factor n=1 Tax=Clostridia TaxID=186801 RepID=UPI000E4F5634|nr:MULTISPECIES: LytTR family DNA-binding domain-containing protein [Clostridia]RHV70272.1 DNA-binding response regulator [Roseburia sp. OM02-15]
MLEIVICDISEQQRKILKQIVQMLCFEYKINANFHGYNSYKALIEDVEEGYITIDVLFLEINLGLANGLDVARKLRNLKSKAQIVLQANTEKYAIAGYDIGATGYILKPYKQDKVTTIVKRLLLQQKKRRIAFKSMRKDIFVAVDDIMYIESNKHSILVHLSDGREIHTYIRKIGGYRKNY